MRPILHGLALVGGLLGLLLFGFRFSDFRLEGLGLGFGLRHGFGFDGLDAAVADRITTSSSFFRITATGRVGLVERQIWCVATADGPNLRFLRWCEEP